MSVSELEKHVRSLDAKQLRRFVRWFDAYRQEASPAGAEDDRLEDLSEAQKQEILRRRAAYLADPSIATPWAGTAPRLLKQLRERRRQKTSPRRG